MITDTVPGDVMPLADLLTTLRDSPPAVRLAVLTALLEDEIDRTGGGPVTIPDDQGGQRVVYICRTPKSRPSLPPNLSDEEWGQVRRMADDFDAGISVDEAMARADLEVARRVAEASRAVPSS